MISKNLKTENSKPEHKKILVNFLRLYTETSKVATVKSKSDLKNCFHENELWAL